MGSRTVEVTVQVCDVCGREINPKYTGDTCAVCGRLFCSNCNHFMRLIGRPRIPDVCKPCGKVPEVNKVIKEFMEEDRARFQQREHKLSDLRAMAEAMRESKRRWYGDDDEVIGDG